MALRADELLDDQEVLRLMSLYLGRPSEASGGDVIEWALVERPPVGVRPRWATTRGT